MYFIDGIFTGVRTPAFFIYLFRYERGLRSHQTTRESDYYYCHK